MIFLSKNDYEEPRCLLNMHPEVTPVPAGRIIEKLDSYLDRNDYDAAERHLRYWISEADASNDMRGKLTLLNEQIGLYRKTGKETECLRAACEALSLAGSPDIEGTVTYGTTLINAAGFVGSCTACLCGICGCRDENGISSSGQVYAVL